MKRIKVILLVSIITIIIIAVICWLTNHKTIEAFCDGLVYTAIAYLVIGGSSLMGNTNFRTSFGYQYLRTLGNQNASDRAKDDFNSMDKSFVFLLTCAIIFIILLGLSFLIKYIFI